MYLDIKKGSYTGAEKDNQGILHYANNGILFLDEVHGLPPECQEKYFNLWIVDPITWLGIMCNGINQMFK